MPKETLLNAKGTRDFPPEEKILRDKIMNILIETFELYGFSPMETPVLERYDLLASKYAGGAEILKETFKFMDQGKRELGLRYDLTVPLCRFIGMNPTIKFPFKRYQIGTVYRDGPVSSDRLRAFLQCDVDIVGTKNMAADAECLILAEAVFKKLKIPVIIEVNNRKFLDGILEDMGVPKENRSDVILTIDKIKKLEQAVLEKELEEKGLSKEQIKKLFALLKETKGTNTEKLQSFKKRVKSTLGKEGVAELEQLFSCIAKAEKKNILFTPSLARGLAYYTGTVFEIFVQKDSISSAIAAGGRYDKMIQQFLNTKLEYPAVGISFGLDRISFILEADQKNRAKTVTAVFIISINKEKEAQALAEKLRAAGIKTETDLLGRGPSKNLEYANSFGISSVLFVGEEEVKKKKYTLRDMKTGKQSKMRLAQIVKKLSH